MATRNTMRSGSGTGGFTLLEVLMATSLLAVGAVSVLVVLATAAVFWPIFTGFTGTWDASFGC